MTTAGMTVLAVRDGDVGVLNVYGEGVYVGDRLRPGTTEEVPPDVYKAVESVLAEEDSVPIEEHRFVVWYDEWVRTGVEVRQTREEVIANIVRDRSRSMDDRVRELYLRAQLNPCIYLDSGDVVYGFQCWWGSVAGFRKKYPEFAHKTVPVPEGNGRWKP